VSRPRGKRERGAFVASATPSFPPCFFPSKRTSLALFFFAFSLFSKGKTKNKKESGARKISLFFTLFLPLHKVCAGTATRGGEKKKKNEGNFTKSIFSLRNKQLKVRRTLMGEDN
jgi:hypothetical protein